MLKTIQCWGFPINDALVLALCVFTKGITGEMIKICKKYNLTDHVKNYLKSGSFPEKHQWKCIIGDEINNIVYRDFHNNTNDVDYKRFKCVHPDPLQVNPVWRVAKTKPHMVDTCMTVAKLIAYPSYHEMLCEYCGCLNYDILLHCALHCIKTKEERDEMWEILVNKLSVEQSVYLFSLEDDVFLNVLMG